MVVSWKTFLEQEQENPVTQLSTGGKNQTVAPSDTINTSKVLEWQKTQTTGTLEKGNWTTRDRIKESITWDEAKRDILNAATTLEEWYKKVQNAVIWAWDYLLKEASSFLKTGKSYETNQEEAAKKVEQLEKSQQENKAAAQEILKEQTVTNKKRSDMLTVVDPYKTQPQYWPYVDYSRERLNVGSIWEVSKNVTVNNDQTMAFISNGLTTVSKPVINGADFQKTLQDAYNAITYEYANFGNLVNPEIVKQYFPAWKDASDEEINRFINECAYDVEQGKRRDISMYAENFLDLAMPDWYTSKHDAVLKLYGDDEYITYWLGEFIKGTATLEWKSKEDILNYVKAVKTINKAVEIVKENGANTKWASDFVIAKTFADDFEGLKEALEIYQNFNLTTKDLATIDAQYTATMEDLKDFAELKPLTDEDKKAFLDQYIIDADGGFFNWLSAVKVNVEWLVPEEYQKWLNVIPGKFIADWYLWNTYEVDGKFYDRNWNEIPRTEARVWLYNAYVNWLVWFSKSVDDLKVDLDKLAETPTDSDKYFERSQLPAIDLVNATFRGWMSVDPMWIALSAWATQFPWAWVYAEQFFEWFFWGLGDIWVKTADMIWYTDGWDESSKEKFAEAFAWLVTMPLAKIKAKLWNEFKIKVNDTVLVKSLKAYKEALKKNIELIEERGEREKIASKNEINREIAPEEQIKWQEKIVDEMVDQETTNRKSMFIKDAMRNAISDFRKTFLEEYSKQVEAEKKANWESTWPTLIDNLFKKAIELGEQMKSERAAEVKADIDNIQKWEVTTPETTEIKVEEQPTPEGEQVKVEETQVEKPGATVEQTKPATPEEKAAGTAKVDEKASQQTKKQIKWILKFIADVLDMWKEIVDFNQRRYRAKKAEKAEREAENKRIIDAEALSDAGLTEEQIRQMQNNPYSETLLDIINSLTKEIKDKKGRITKVKQETSLTRDEIQREVLSRWIERLQKHVDKLVEMKKLLKEMYWELEKRKNIDTSKFPDSKPLQNVLKDYGYWIEVEVDPETMQQKATVYKLDWTDASPSEMWEMKYIEDFMNKQLKFEKKSEADLFKNRQWLKWNEDTYGKNGRSKALENSFRDAFNKFIEEQGDVKLLRTIDKWFTELSDWIDTLRELLNKDNTIKDNAKNKILKWDNETVNQIDEIIPWFKQLVELTKVAPEIINQWVKAKRMTQSTWQKTASVVRYMFVGWAPTLIVPKFVRNLWLAAWSAAAVLLGSVLFKVSENFWLKMKHKIQWIKPDLTLYDTFVNNLKITDNEKAIYKRKINEQIKELTESAEIKTEAEFNKLIDEIAEILTERAANEIAENKLRSRGTEPEEPATPKGPDDKTPPSGWTPELTPEEKQIIKDASAIWGKEYSPAAEKAADAVEEIKQTIEDAQTDDATAKLEERGEDVTPESIKNEIENPKPKSIVEELWLVKEWEFENKTQEINVKEVDTKLLEEAWENPEKYGVSKEELIEIEEELQRRWEQDAMAQMRAEDARDTNEDAANMAEINELDQKKANAKTPEEKARIQKQIDEKTNKAIDQIQKKRNLESTAEAEEALLEQNNASYNRIEAWKDTSVWKFRQNSYSTLLFAEKYWMKAQKPLSRTSSIENIMENPNPKTKARLLEEKKRHTEEKIKKSKYAKNREKQIAELQKINEAIEENNKNLQALQEKIDTEKELTAKRSKATTREEKKELTKQIDENNKELEKLLDEQQKDLRDMPETEEVVEEYDENTGKSPEEIELEHYHENWLKDQKARISELKENISKREKAKEEANWDMEKWNIFDDDTLEKAKKELSDRESELKNVEENDKKLAEEEKGIKEVKAPENESDKQEWSKPITKKELKEKWLTDGDIEMVENLNIASNPVNDFLRDWTEMWPFDEWYVKKTIKALKKLDSYEWESERWWYDNEIFWDDPQVGDVWENKWLWFSSDRDAYWDTPVLYKITSKWYGTKDARIESAKERDLISMPWTKFRLDKVYIENWRKVYEVSEVIDKKSKVLDLSEKMYRINAMLEAVWDMMPEWKKTELTDKRNEHRHEIVKEIRELPEKERDALINEIYKKYKWIALNVEDRIVDLDVMKNAISEALEKEKEKNKPKELQKKEETKKSEVKEEKKTEEKKKEEPKEEKEPEPLVKQEDNGKAYAMKWNPTSKEMFERMQYLRNKAKQNWGKISFKDRSELEFLMDRYKTKLEEEAKQEYNPTEKQDLDREELWSIWWINVPTYWMSID